MVSRFKWKTEEDTPYLVLKSNLIVRHSVVLGFGDSTNHFLEEVSSLFWQHVLEILLIVFLHQFPGVVSPRIFMSIVHPVDNYQLKLSMSTAFEIAKDPRLDQELHCKKHSVAALSNRW